MGEYNWYGVVKLDKNPNPSIVEVPQHYIVKDWAVEWGTL